MSLLTRLSTAAYLIRHGDLPVDIRERIADEIDEDNAFVDQLLAETFGDKLADVTTVRAIHARRPNLTPVGGGA